MKLSIYFNGQYWLGLVEFYDDKKQLRVFQHIFGREPKTQDIFDFIYQDLERLTSQTWHPKETSTKPLDKKINPKRLQRLVAKEREKPSLSTKSQAALSQQKEAQKLAKKHDNKIKSQAEKEAYFLQKQKQRRLKKRGH